MSEDPHPSNGEAPDEEETVARRSRETGGDAPAAAAIEEREALATEGNDDEGASRDEAG